MAVYSDNLVEAIEEGKIVLVSEHYARREGLPIVRKQEPKMIPQVKPKIEEKDVRRISDVLKKKEGWRESQVKSELIENFDWKIRAERRRRGLSRKQFAKLLNEQEETIRLLEYGRLPSNDFVIINKIQAVLGLNLRKDGADFTKSPREMLDSSSTVPEGESNAKPKSDIPSTNLDILEEEMY